MYIIRIVIFIICLLNVEAELIRLSRVLLKHSEIEQRRYVSIKFITVINIITTRLENEYPKRQQSSIL